MRNLPDPADLRQQVAEASRLPPLSSKRGRLERLVADYGRSFERQDRALVVALAGATGAGKSTLINALAGADIALEGVDRPTSRHPVVYAPDDALLDELAAFPAKVARYAVRPGARWGGQVFIDTPDVNSVMAEHREVARGLAEVADVVMVVMHRGSVAEAAQADFLDEFARRRRLLFVLNFADQLGPEARSELKAQVRRIAASRFGLAEAEAPVFAVSALSAKGGADPSGEMAALVAALEDLASRSTADRVRRSNALAVLRELEGELSAAKREVDSALEEISRELDGGFSKAGEALREDFAQRLRLSEGHLGNEVRRQASSRWWGPAAWWMRLSMVGAGGIGAAAWLVRRNLPLGLAVGAASAAVDRLQEYGRGRAAEQRVLGDEVADDAGAAGGAARVALSPARSAAHRRGLLPEQLELEAPEALVSELRAVRASAWRFTLDGAVPEAVRGWWRWARFLLLPLVNLPLLALFADVAYRVVRGYLGGQYLPAGYFLNALVLGLLLAMGGGVLASWSLAGVAARARRIGLERFRTALGELHASAVDRARSALSAPRAAAAAVSEMLRQAEGPDHGERSA